MPYQAQLFEMSGLRHSKLFVQKDGFRAVTLINFPEHYGVHDLRSICSEYPIISCVILPRKALMKSASWPHVRTRAEITFQTHMHAKEIVTLLNGVKIGSTTLEIRPSTDKSQSA